MFSLVLRVLFWEIEQIPGFLKEGCTLSQWDALNCTLPLRRGTPGTAEYSYRRCPLHHPHEARYDDTASWYASAYGTDNSAFGKQPRRLPEPSLGTALKIQYQIQTRQQEKLRPQTLGVARSMGPGIRWHSECAVFFALWETDEKKAMQGLRSPVTKQRD